MSSCTSPRLVVLIGLALLTGCGKKPSPAEAEQPAQKPTEGIGQAPELMPELKHIPANAEAARLGSQNNMKQLTLAVHDYASANEDRLPPAFIADKDGKALLSWRVVLLPYLGESKLYKEFKLEQPWDSEHNEKLLPRMPKVYALPGVTTKEPHVTFYRVFFGPGTLFSKPDGQCAYTIGEIPDGTSNTIFAVEADERVPWTKPDELSYDPLMIIRLPKLGKLVPDQFLVVMMDGSVRWVSKKVSEKTLRSAIEPDDGQPLGTDW